MAKKIKEVIEEQEYTTEEFVGDVIEAIADGEGGKQLGDVVEDALTAVGGKAVSHLIEKITGRPCNCNKRKQALNNVDTVARRGVRYLIDSVRNKK